MTSGDRGPLLYAYRPIPANPMTVALLLLVLVAMAVFNPSPTYVFENGIEISVPLWRRILGEPRYFAWSEIRAVYPRSYEVAGSFLSPFASSAGTLVHTGIGLETKGGRRLLVRFTPGSIRAFRAESQGYAEAMAAIRDRFARHGERMVTTARPLSDEEVLAMQAHAREPLVSIVSVFFAFFLPPAIVAAVLLIASAARVALTPVVLAASIVVALLPPAASMARTLRQSERRNDVLSELAKYQEHLREAGAPTHSDGTVPEVNPKQG